MKTALCDGGFRNVSSGKGKYLHLYHHYYYYYSYYISKLIFVFNHLIINNILVD